MKVYEEIQPNVIEHIKILDKLVYSYVSLSEVRSLKSSLRRSARRAVSKNILPETRGFSYL